MADRRRKPRLVGIVAGAVVVVAAVVSVFVIDWDTSLGEEPPPVRPLKTMVIGEGTSRSVRHYPGRVQATQRVDLAFRVSGPLIELPVKAGQIVEAGELVARIDPRDFEISLQEIQSSLDEAAASLEAMRRGRPEDIARLRAEVQGLESALTLAREEYDRARSAHASGGLTDLELARKLEARDSAESALAQARENLNISERGARPEDIEAAEARVRGLEARRDDAKAALNDTELRAAFAGRVATLFVDNFQNVQEREPILSLQDISEVEIVVNVPEVDVVRNANRGREAVVVVVEFETLPGRTFEAVLEEFSTEADPVTQTFEATLVMPAPDDVMILPGMTAEVTLFVEDPDATTDVGYLVPIEAVPVDGTGEFYVWIVRDVGGGTLQVQRTGVKVNEMIGDQIIVVSGVSQGDEIATAGVHLLSENQAVRRYVPKAAGGES